VEDLHAGKKFLIKDFRVTWEHGMNYLVSPYYPESGGTVIDWMDENSWVMMMTMILTLPKTTKTILQSKTGTINDRTYHPCS
jgi:hypothetical protein